MVLPTSTPSNTPLPGATSTDTITVSPSPTGSATQTLVLPTSTDSGNTPLPGSTSTDTPSITPSIDAQLSTFSSTQVLPATFTSTLHPARRCRSATPTFSSTRTPVPTFTFTSVVPAMITDVGPTAWGPRSLTVTAGTTVTWSWSGFHSVNSTTPAEPYSSGAGTTGGAFSHQFNTPGDYTFDSAVDGTVMSGFIHVSGAGPTNTPTTATGNGPLGIDSGAAWPNPSPKAFSVKLLGPADSLEVKVYTVSQVCVGTFTSGPSAARAAGPWRPSPPASSPTPGSGTYYCTGLRQARIGQELETLAWEIRAAEVSSEGKLPWRIDETERPCCSPPLCAAPCGPLDALPPVPLYGPAKAEMYKYAFPEGGSSIDVKEAGGNREAIFKLKSDVWAGGGVGVDKQRKLKDYVANGALEFQIRGAKGGEKLDVGFVQSKGLEANELAFQILVPLNRYVKITTQWQNVTIPLKDFPLEGSRYIDSEQRQAKGPFNWNRVIEFVTSREPGMAGFDTVHFANIQVVGSYDAAKVAAAAPLVGKPTGSVIFYAEGFATDGGGGYAYPDKQAKLEEVAGGHASKMALKATLITTAWSGGGIYRAPLDLSAFVDKGVLEVWAKGAQDGEDLYLSLVDKANGASVRLPVSQYVTERLEGGLDQGRRSP